MSSLPSEVDVLVVGAGPVGLITAYQLAKFGGVSVAIIEKHEKNMQDAYGRAITLYPRSSELLDQLGLADELAQQCFACRETATYNSKGEEVEGRGWNFMESMRDTAWDFALVLRQKYQEEVFRKAMKRYDVVVQAPVELKAIAVDDILPLGSHKIAASVLDHRSGVEKAIKCKYLIGCDGGRSSVRHLVNIPFEGSMTEDRWVRIDGVVRTSVPKPRTYCSIESPTHGNVLWVGLDRGTTRIGYAFTADRAKGYDVFDEAAAIQEAVAAAKPFDLEFERVDWWTIYSIGQRIAQNFSVADCVFLAGDAAHTHSSGAAQGMNTGIHDSVNLAWKLSLVLRGLAKPDILHSYQAERMPNVRKLIQYDKDISRLMTNRPPENWQGKAEELDVNQLLGKLMAEAGTFSSGLGIRYDATEDVTMVVEGSWKPADSPDKLTPGMRAPDVTLLRPGTFVPTRLHSETPNTACFSIIVFAGQASSTGESEFYAASASLENLVDRGLVRYVTVLATKASSSYEVLGHEPLGRIFFDDAEHSAYRRYGVSLDEGALVVIRPDGWIGTMVALRASSVRELVVYFSQVFVEI